MRSLIVVAGSVLVASSAVAQPVRLTRLTEFGCESCEGPLSFGRIETLALTADRRVVVVDRSEPYIRVFDSTGKPIRAFGRAGQGPAELVTPVAASIAASGEIEVIDMMRRRLVRFGPTGEDRSATPLSGFANIGAFAPHGGHAIAGISYPGRPVLTLLRATGDKPTELLQAGQKDFPERPPGNIEALSVAVAPDGSFVVGDGRGAYLIRRYDPDGRPTGEIRRAIPRVRRTPGEIRAEAEQRDARLAAMQRRMGRSASSVSRTALSSIPPERDWFDAYALRFDERGRLWVRVERAAPGRTLFDIFDSAGRYLGEVEVPARFREYALGSGLLAAAVADSLGVERINLWSVSEP